jgi:hypothetical protein
MDDSNSKSASHSEDAVIRIATHEISPTQEGVAKISLNTNDQNLKNNTDVKVGDVEVQVPQPTAQADEKVKLQDQKNLLPLKQLLIVFAGLSCALFCKFIPLFDNLRADTKISRLSSRSNNVSSSLPLIFFVKANWASQSCNSPPYSRSCFQRCIDLFVGRNSLFALFNGMSADVWPPIRYLWPKSDSLGKYGSLSSRIDIVRRITKHDHAYYLS